MAEMNAAYAGVRVLITGGLGFIGSNLARTLAAAGAHLTLVDCLVPDTGGNPFNIEGLANISVINTDVEDVARMAPLLRTADVLFSLAGVHSHIDGQQHPLPDLDRNVRRTLALLETVRTVQPGLRVVFAGSRSQYGRVDHIPVAESQPLHPSDLNGLHHSFAEAYYLYYHRIFGLPVTVLRLTNIFGPRHQMRHARQGYVNWFIRLAIENAALPVYLPGTQLRDLCYVDDAVAALLTVGSQPATIGKIFNVGTGHGCSIRESAERIIALAGSGHIITVPFPAEQQCIETGDYVADCSRLAAITGWQAQVSFADGIRETIAFYRRFRAHYF